MNSKRKIERYLRVSPKPVAPDSLLDKLQTDVALLETKARGTAIRRWFAPGGESISLRRVAVAAIIMMVVVLSLGYGATKVIRHFTLFEATFEYPGDNAIYSVGVGIVAKGDTNIKTEEDAQEAAREFYALYKQGKAKETKPGVWVATLSNGEEFAYGGNPEHIGLSDAERKKLLREQFDEINELRKAGKFERTFIEESEVDGVKHRLYQDTFTLSNGRVIRMTVGESAEDDNAD